jgi:NhaC family Na+:H+ antiporter
MSRNAQRERTPVSLAEALLPLVSMLVLFAAGAIFLGLSSEMIVVVLLGAATVAGIIAVRHGHGWDAVQRGTGEKLASVMPALLILLSIGMLIATWVLSGTIPFLVYWGVRLVEPRFLVVTSFLATALMSTFTGTSWGSAGTIGVALMGTAAALDAPMAATAGAVLSGAYFGDKMSPLSDSTIISSMAAEAPLFRHIRHMVYTAGPSFVVCVIVYLTIGLNSPAGGEAPETARIILDDLDRAFRLHWMTLLPPAIVVYGIVRRVPAALAILLSCAGAALLALTLQGFTLQDTLLAAVSGFRAEMIGSRGVDAAAMSPAFQALVQRGGLYSMSNTLVLVITAFVLAAAMDVSGSLTLLIERLLRAVRSVFGLIAATMAAGASMIAMTSHGGVTALVIGGLFQKAYRERGLAPENLSRSLEDSITITEPLMPWTVSAVFMATTLGVPTLQYAPWAVFCYGGPFFSLLIAGLYRYTHVGIRETDDAPVVHAEAAAKQ